MAPRRGRGVKRVCLTGVESTGKSTLAPRLAAHVGGVVVPEYGRCWAETHGPRFTPADLVTIARGHLAARLAAEAEQPRLIIEDTDIVTTAAWHIMLHGGRNPTLDAIAATADLYLLFAADTPWVDDGTRCFKGADRARFDAVIAGELARRGIVPIVIAGDWAAREQAALTAIARLINA